MKPDLWNASLYCVKRRLNEHIFLVHLRFSAKIYSWHSLLRDSLLPKTGQNHIWFEHLCFSFKTSYLALIGELCNIYCEYYSEQATGLDAWASRVKCPARFVSHLHDICIYIYIGIYIWVVYSFCLVCCLFIIVTTQFVAWYKPCKPKPSTYDPPDNHPLAEIQRPMLRLESKQQICHQHANTDHFGK